MLQQITGFVFTVSFAEGEVRDIESNCGCKRDSQSFEKLIKDWILKEDIEHLVSDFLIVSDNLFEVIMTVNTNFISRAVFLVEKIRERKVI